MTDNILAFCILVGGAFLVGLIAMEFIVPVDLRWKAPALRFNRVGGLTHWRCGRLGGSFYIAKGR